MPTMPTIPRPAGHEAYLDYVPLSGYSNNENYYVIASLILNRPKAANAFDAKSIAVITHLLDQVRANPAVRVLVIQGKGRHFCSGADLTWMQRAEELSAQDNRQDVEAMRGMFDRIHQLSVPTITIPKGITYGGGIGLVACSDISISSSRVRFCFSEVHIGLLPAVILPYVYQKTSIGMVRRYILTAEPFGHREAIEMGLVQHSTEDKLIEHQLHKVINHLLKASPDSLSEYKKLEAALHMNNNLQSADTVESIAKIRHSDAGKAGIRSAISKTPPPWSCFIKNDSRILV